MKSAGYMESTGYMKSAGFMESTGFMESAGFMEEQYRSCYQLEKIEFDNYNKTLLDIDATYIVHLENNGRLDSVKAQLNKFRPTKDVYILHNEGYRTCEKDEYINKPALDLVDAFLYIFKDAQEKDYKHVLVLEDDFIFNDRIRDKTVQKNIMNFISNRNYDIYALGRVPYLQKAYDNNTSISLYGGATHAMIYSRNCIDKTLQTDRKSIEDWDYFTGQTFRIYMYNEPLCYQLFPETENQKYWGNNVVKIIKLLKLDVQVEPGYSIAYIMSRGVYGLCIILVVWLFITIFRIKSK
jgi:hypothetical protein